MQAGRICLSRERRLTRRTLFSAARRKPQPKLNASQLLCRYGAEAVIPGLDQGLTTMRPGGVRRLFVPGNLAFPKGLSAAAGRPRVAPNSPVIFDVQFLYQPGFEDLEEGEYE